MADIGIVDGQGDSLNLHINVIQNSCLVENKDSSCEESISNHIFSKELKDYGGISQELLTESKLTSKATSPDQIEVTLETSERLKELQQVADICEASAVSSQPDCAEQIEHGDMHCNMNSELLVAEVEPKSLDLSDESDIMNTESGANGDQVPLVNSCLTIKDTTRPTVDSINSSGDPLTEEKIQINASDKNSLPNVVEESYSSSKGDEAVASLSNDASQSEDRVMEEQTETDLTEQAQLSNEDLHTDNQEKGVCESNVHQCAVSNKMSEIKIIENVTDSDHDVSLLNVNGEHFGNSSDFNGASDVKNSTGAADSPNISVCVDGKEVSKCENYKVPVEDNDVCDNSDLGIVILESSSIAELEAGKENIFSETSNNISIDSNEELMEHNVDKDKLDAETSLRQASVDDSMNESVTDDILDNSPANLVIEEDDEEDMEVMQTSGDKLKDKEELFDCHGELENEALINSTDKPEGEGKSNSDDQLLGDRISLKSKDKLDEGAIIIGSEEVAFNSDKSYNSCAINIDDDNILSCDDSETGNKTDNITENTLKDDNKTDDKSNITDDKISTDSKTDDTDGKADETMGMVNKTDEIDMDDDILLLEDSDTINIMPSKFSFKNILKVPKKDLPVPETSGQEENAIIVDELDDDAVQDYVSDTKKNEDSIENENSSKIETTRKRYSIDNDESNIAKRPKTDDQTIESKDLIAKESGRETKSASPNNEPKMSIKEKVEDCPSSIQTTTKVLQAFITAHFRAFLKNQKQINTEKLNRRTRNMQTATNLWKETAKHLERSVQELTIVAEKIEKRKCRATELKNLSKKSIGIQVNDSKPKQPASSPSNVKRHDSTPVGSVNIPSQHQQSPRLQIPANAVTQAAGKNKGSPQNTATPPKKMLAQPTPGPPMAAPRNSPSPRQATPANGRIKQNNVKHMPSSQGNNSLDSSNLIDLTDEDDVSKTVKKTPSQTSVQSTPRQVANKQNLLPLANGFSTNTALPGGSPALLMAPNSQVMLGPLQNSQMISGPPSTMAPFHLIPIGSSSLPPPKGPVFAFLPNQRPPLNLPAQNNSPRSVLPATTNAATNSTTSKSATYTLPQSVLINSMHPAPLPQNQDSGNAPLTAKKRPPKPGLKISRVTQGIVLSWNMPSLNEVEKIASYQLFAYQENENSVPKSSLWKKVGDVKALPLPMACTLTQFQEGNRYHFAVRAVDIYGRCGQYSDASSIFLRPKS